MSAWVAGAYDWQLTITRPDGSIYSQNSGTLTTVPNPSIIATAAGSSAGQLAWNTAALGQQGRLEYFDAATATWIALAGTPPATAGGPTTYDLSAVPLGDYLIRTVYSEGGSDFATVTTTLHVGLAGTPVGTGNNLEIFSSPLTIAKATAANGNPTTRISFADTPDTESFRYRPQGSSSWTSLAVSGGSIDVGNLPNGSYDYELLATRPGESAPHAHATGSFSLSHAGETFTTPIAPISGIYATSSGQVRWPAPNHPVAVATLYWKPVGTSVWSSAPIQPAGSEFVVDVRASAVGTYDFAVAYQNYSPVTGDLIITDGTLGIFSVSQSQVAQTTYVQVTTSNYVPASGLPHINGLRAFNYRNTDGTWHDFIYVPDFTSLTFNYNNVSYSVNGVSFTLGGGQYSYIAGFYGADTGHFGFSNVYYADVGNGFTSASNVPATSYNLTYYSNGMPIAQNVGTATMTAGQVSVSDQTPAYTPAYYTYSTTWVPQTTYSIQTNYYASVVSGAPTTTTDTVAGTPVAPSLADLTPAPIPQWHAYSLIGTADAYLYRGANPAYESVTTTFSGMGSTVTSARLTQLSTGTAAALTTTAAHSQDLGSAVQLTLSHQTNSERIDAVALSDAPVAHSQAQTFSLTQAAKTDQLFGPTRRFEARDATRDGTAPVSLPFSLAFMDTAQDATGHAASVSVAPTVNRSYDRWGDVLSVSDPRNRNWLTRYSYNADGKVLAQTAPDGATTRAAYDLLGHTVSLTDANGHTTSMQFDGAGNLIAQTNADGGHVYHRFDAFGERVQTWTQTASTASGIHHDHYTVTHYTYDRDGRLTQTIRPGADIEVVGTDAAGHYLTQAVAGTQIEHWSAVLNSPYGGTTRDTYSARQVGSVGTDTAGGNIESYQYDSLGRRIGVTVAAADGTDSQTTTTRYDLSGQVTAVTGADGKTIRSAYDALGRMVYRQDAGQIAANTYSSWSYVGGSSLVQDHVGLDGVDVRSQYDFAGELLASKTLSDRKIDADKGQAGQHLVYRYDAAGRVVRIDDNSQAWVVKTSTYRYDAAGNRIHERTQLTTTTTDADGKSQATTRTVADIYLAYDAQNRLRIADDGRAALAYGYDAVGNRTGLSATYRNDSDTLKNFTYGYAYDAMNRLTIDQGTLHAGLVGIDASHGTQIAYDLAGRRVSETHVGQRLTTRDGVALAPVLDDSGQPFYDPDTGAPLASLVTTTLLGSSAGLTTETYRYDAAGNLTGISRDGVLVEEKGYDAQGRLIVERTPAGLLAGTSADKDNATLLQSLGYASGKTVYAYEAGSLRLHAQTTTNGVGGGSRTLADGDTLNSDLVYGYDAAGNLVSTTGEAFAPGYGYEGSDSTYAYVAIGEAFHQVSSRSQTNGRTGQASQRYDGSGNLLAVTQAVENALNPNRSYITDAEGHVLEVDRFDAQGRMVGREHDLVVGGEQVLRTADDAIEADWKNLDGQSTQVMGAGTARTQGNLANAPRAYLVRAGDTLPRIARAVWGDASLWTYIAEANGIADPDSISAGQLLSLPSPDAVGAGNKFGSATLRPYDPSLAVGDTSPNLPPPPSDSGDGCGGVGQILQAVVMIVVAVYAPALIPELGGGSFFAAAGSAALGNVAGQVVGNIAGVQDGFSLESV